MDPKKNIPSPKTQVQRIPIDKFGKQLLVITSTTMEGDRFAEFMQQILAWLDTDDPLFIIKTTPGTEVHLVKLTKHGARNVKQQDN